MLEKVIENWTSRLDYIRASRGSPMPEIIFKMGKELDVIRKMSLVSAIFRTYELVLTGPKRTVDTEHQPPNSPSRVIAGDDHIAECSDLFREAIKARNVYAAWARKLTNARPNDPMMQSYHQEVTKAGENVELLLVQLNVPLSVSLPPKKRRGACRDEKATHPAVLRLSQGRLRQLVALAKLIAPSFQSQMSGRFLKVTVADDVDYRALSKWLESSGSSSKFMLKQDRPVKVVIRGLPPIRSRRKLKQRSKPKVSKF
ncbi:hypothetical protein TNCV_596011 [Trichonephila clavipes]|uniref:Uncharacterized protein n=1 Tax=Trichonephila clavipes TaxID=2585209 RepID=A0A8X6RCT1_TRICX|nr:hypothetical protein TNCV_596011 [Trichonephila clavipes]